MEDGSLLGIGLDDMIIFMSGLSVFLTFAAIWYGLLNQAPAVRRIKDISERREALRAGIIGPRKRREKLQTSTAMHQVVTKLNLLRHTQSEKYSEKLTQAGMRSKDALVRFLFFKLVVPPVAGVVILFLVYVLNFWNLDTMMKPLVTVMSVVIGFYGPDLLVKSKISKRRELIRKSMPDGLDLMVICAEAGLSLDATMKRVSDELAVAAPELSDEMSLTSLELGFLPERRKALENLSSRVVLPAVRGLVTTLMQAEKYGTPLGNSLRVLSAEFRNERMMKAEEKAARLPALLTVPMIIFILPPLFVVLIGPAILRAIDAFSRL